MIKTILAALALALGLSLGAVSTADASDKGDTCLTTQTHGIINVSRTLASGIVQTGYRYVVRTIETCPDGSQTVTVWKSEIHWNPIDSRVRGPRLPGKPIVR